MFSAFENVILMSRILDSAKTTRHWGMPKMNKDIATMESNIYTIRKWVVFLGCAWLAKQALFLLFWMYHNIDLEALKQL